jgi:competence ComEA-like helix-hairpin-helix protein
MSHSPLGRSLFAALLLVFGFRASAEWVDLKGCKMAENASNDGDSFHVKHKGREYVFRLYFVDAPETSLLIPDRVGEQANAFETTKEEVLEAGKGAAVFTKKRLGRDFKVSTRWEDARGMSRGGRHYAFVETAEGEDLGELLLAAGWARSYGMKAATKSSSAGQLQQRYDRLEQKARRAGVGIWGDAKGSVSMAEEQPEEKERAAEDGGAFMAAGLMESALASAVIREAKSDEDAPAPAPVASSTPAHAVKSSGGKSKLDINTASKEELADLPGIGEVKAAAIIAARPFAGSFDLLRVPGITPATLKEIYPFVGE